MFHNRNRLGVGLVTLVAFGLGLPSAVAQVVTLPTSGVGWGAMAAALDPETDDVMVAGSGVSDWPEFVASGVSYSGTINKTFGGGLVETDVTGIGSESWPYACAVDSEGRLLAGGQYYYSSKKASGWGFGLVRYDTNGKLDTTFNKTGIVKTNFTNTEDFASIKAIALQGSGTAQKILVAGGYTNNEIPVYLARYTASGALDTTFGSGGTVSTAMPVPFVDVTAVELQSDGSIVVGATFFSASELSSMALIRYTANGRLDTTFGTNGIATLSIAGDDSHLNDIIIDADDNIIAVGDGDGDLAVARFTPDGELDTTFGTAGYVTKSFGATACAVALDSAGNIVVSGVVAGGLGNYDSELLVARFTSSGAVDNTFGDVVVNGVPQGYSADFPYSAQGIAHSIQIQSNGQIVAVGCNEDEVNAVVHYNSNGTPDKSF